MGILYFTKRLSANPCYDTPKERYNKSKMNGPTVHERRKRIEEAAHTSCYLERVYQRATGQCKNLGRSHTIMSPKKLITESTTQLHTGAVEAGMLEVIAYIKNYSPRVL